MSKIAGFIALNIRTIGVIYAAGAAVTYVAVIAFWVWVYITERRDRKEHPEEYNFIYEDGCDDMTAGTVMLISLITATGCAIVWCFIPILLFALWVYATIEEKFPQLMGNMTEDIDKETEGSE